MSSFFSGVVNISGFISETIASAFDFQIFNVTSTGAVVDDDDAAFLINDANVEIFNEGSIVATSSFGTAIDVVDGGSAAINNVGFISGGFNGINFSDTQIDSVLDNFGTVTSDSRALDIDGSGLTVNNFGAIIASDTQRNGTVYADATAQDFTINNAGLIDAGPGLEGAAFSAELSESGNDFTINNSAQISGRGNAGAGSTQAGDGIRLERTRVDGELDGTTTGLFTGEINNNGLLSSEGANGTVAAFRAVNGVDFQGTLNNEGSIFGVQNGVYFGNATPAGGGDHTGGVFNNAGLVSSDSRALNIDGTGLTVNNAGAIVASATQRNGTVYSDSTAQDFTLNNTGLIDAGEGLDGAAFSAELAASGNDFTINNSGLIAGRGNAGAGSTQAGDGIRLERARVDGELDGTTTGLFTGEINNSGLLSSDGANGTVAAFRAVNGVDFQGTLNNDGLIFGVQNGVYFGNATPAGGGDHTGGVFNNEGLVNSDSRALNIDGTGLTVNNTGAIIASATQRNGTVYSDSTAQDFLLNNVGLIDAGEGLDGAAFSAELAASGNDFTINNSGLIAGRGNAGAGSTQAGDGIRLERARVDGELDGTTTGLFTGEIINTGLISSDGANGTVAGFRAVNGVDFQGTLINEGTISGVQNGVYFGNATPAGGGDHSDGLFVNAGLVSSGSRALNIDGSGLTVVNQGSILGTGNQRNGTVYADATADDYVFVNNGLVDAGAGNDGSAVSLQVGDQVSAVVVNNGQLQGQGDSAEANLIGHGLRLFQGAGDDSTFDGVTANFGNIFASSDNDAAAGVSIEGVELTGVLANFGTISGNEIGIDASSADGVNILNAAFISGDVLLSGGDDVFIITSTSFVAGDIQGGAGNDTLSLIGFSDDAAQALLDSGSVSGFENVVFDNDFGVFDDLDAVSDASSFGGGAEIVDDFDVANDLDALADLAALDVSFA